MQPSLLPVSGFRSTYHEREQVQNQIGVPANKKEKKKKKETEI